MTIKNILFTIIIFLGGFPAFVIGEEVSVTVYNNDLALVRETRLIDLKKGVQKYQFQDVAAKELVELYSFLYVGFLVLDEAEINAHKKFIANRYITNALANARKNSESIKNEQFSDLLHADEILQ